MLVRGDGEKEREREQRLARRKTHSDALIGESKREQSSKINSPCHPRSWTPLFNSSQIDFAATFFLRLRCALVSARRGGARAAG